MRERRIETASEIATLRASIFELKKTLGVELPAPAAEAPPADAPPADAAAKEERGQS